MKVREFLKVNNLKQVELSRYLGVTEAAISNVVKGKSEFSEENLIKIMNNPYGWDTSMLTQSRDEAPEKVGKKVEIDITDRLLAIIEDQKRDTQMLLGMLREKDYEIKRLREELNERKKGVAQSADHSLSADAV